MRSFKDTAEREWVVKVSLPIIKKVYEGCGVLLPRLMEDNCKLYAELCSDCLKAGEVLWCLCEKQADELGLKPDEFAEALSGQPFEDALEAVGWATADFFPNQQRQVLHAAMKKAKESANLEMEKAMQMVNSLDPKSPGNDSTDSATNSPESSESNPGDLRLAS